LIFAVLHQRLYNIKRQTELLWLRHAESSSWVDRSKMVQATITKSSPSAAWKILVSGTAKLFH